MSDTISNIKSSGGDVDALFVDEMSIVALETCGSANPLADVYQMLDNKTYKGAVSNKRLSTTTPIVFDKDVAVSVKEGYVLNVIYTDGEGNDDPTGFILFGITIVAGRQFYVSIAHEDLESEIKKDEMSAVYCDNVGINTLRLDGMDDSAIANYGFEWVLGGYRRSGDVITEDGYVLIYDDRETNRIRTVNRYPMPRSLHAHVDDPSIRVMIVVTDRYSRTYIDDYSIVTQVGTQDVYVTIPDEVQTDGLYFMVCLVSTTGDVQSVADMAKKFTISPNTDSITSKIDGKRTLIYRFGGDGNDWCFVRTPESYDPKRDKPYPFVICNHGNGWVMDGSAQYANWTKRTMYVPSDDPDYIDDPTQYNATDDESLWYSNPTIEALLEAGYVVCGCENYGDGLYGNEDCRSACASFFQHMVRNYNVEGRCCMIGASNGAQTSINASYLLGGLVKAMILQYPLTCLINHYNNHQSHQAGIRSAYGIEDQDPTEDELISATRTHDFLHTDVVGEVKCGYFPPTKLYYSPDDEVTDCDYNAIPMMQMLESSNKIVEYVEVTGGHGDASHFEPEAYVEFFNRF